MRCLVVIRQDGDAAWATCTCGWSGPRRPDEPTANRDAADHATRGDGTVEEAS